MKPRPGALYPILNVEQHSELDAALRLAEQLGRFRVSMVQLRCKNLPVGTFVEAGHQLVELSRRCGFALIINDRCDVALAVGAAGVHLGDSDLPVAAARQLLGPDAVIGYSTHSSLDVTTAGEQADYLGFGPVFESPTKAGVREARGLHALAAACADAGQRPVVAIGGLTLEQAEAAWASGASSVAVISELQRADDPQKVIEQYQHKAHAAGLTL